MIYNTSYEKEKYKFNELTGIRWRVLKVSWNLFKKLKPKY